MQELKMTISFKNFIISMRNSTITYIVIFVYRTALGSWQLTRSICVIFSVTVHSFKVDVCLLLMNDSFNLKSISSSHVFGNISKILSKSDEQNEAMLVSSSLAMGESNSHVIEHNFTSQMGHVGAKLCNYIELNGMFEVIIFTSTQN